MEPIRQGPSGPIALLGSHSDGAVDDRVAEAAAAGARFIVFPDAFVPGYPDWVWRTKPFQDGEAEWYSRLTNAAVPVPRDATRRVG